MLPNSRNEAYSYLKNRFGIEKEELAPLNLRQINGDYWLAQEETELKTETSGIRALRSSERGFKPTTYFLQMMGERITKNTVQLSDGEIETILQREMIERTDMEEGYVAMKHDGKVIGCGFFMNDLVSTRISKSRTKQLRQILDM